DADRQTRRALIAGAARSARLALRIAGRVARERPEVYRLAGRLAWLRGREEQALAWWASSLDAAEGLGARPEIGRTYAEVGRSLQTSGRAGRLGTLDAEGCLAAGRRTFDELGLDEDDGGCQPLAAAEVG